MMESGDRKEMMNYGGETRSIGGTTRQKRKPVKIGWRRVSFCQREARILVSSK